MREREKYRKKDTKTRDRERERERQRERQRKREGTRWLTLTELFVNVICVYSTALQNNRPIAQCVRVLYHLYHPEWRNT